MKHVILIITVATFVGCASSPKVIPNSPYASLQIELAIREADKNPKGELTKADFEKVTKLKLNGYKITDVSAIAKLTELTNLDLSNNKQADVSALAALINLPELDLQNNEITDISPLTGLTQLEVLYLDDNSNLTKADTAKLQTALPDCDIAPKVTK